MGNSTFMRNWFAYQPLEAASSVEMTASFAVITTTTGYWLIHLLDSDSLVWSFDIQSDGHTTSRAARRRTLNVDTDTNIQALVRERAISPRFGRSEPQLKIALP
ncbi:hypothetical protein [Paraburkholderia sp. C35]|uniref:hypothetical protein n=1 Tax=Paraburkholderia sp. C35 TaxID=2126993 RepID=UPI0013A547A1|nr:hypothetical protein [Paraburkholderia sp. C35]